MKLISQPLTKDRSLVIVKKTQGKKTQTWGKKLTLKTSISEFFGKIVFSLELYLNIK